MKEQAGRVFSIGQDNRPLKGCTVSKEVRGGNPYIAYYSMGEGTDISAENFPYHKLIIVDQGKLEAYGPQLGPLYLGPGQAVLTPRQSPVGLRTDLGVVFTEVTIEKDDYMNDLIKAGQVFTLKDLVPYQEGKIVNMDLIHTDTMKFLVMAFDKGTGLREHSAPGQALVFALDGQATISYEGEKHLIEAGQTFHFAKNGLHAVRAESKFKMALLLTLD